MPTAIETPQLLLRPLTLDDAPAYWHLVNLPAVLRYTGEAPKTSLDDVREVLRTRPLHDYQVHGYGRMACIEKSSSRLVGFCGLKFVADLQEVDIGYRFLPDCWGKGYATESARALMAHGREGHGITASSAWCSRPILRPPGCCKSWAWCTSAASIRAMATAR
jgi:ribosomal-protein-alanine N-acetyltransferase